MATVALYARKSTESEDRQVLSIDSQIRELRQFAEREGFKIARVFRESKSAKAPGRPIFNDVLSLVNKGEVDAILCWKHDRLARNPVDGGAVIWAMEERKLESIVTPQREFINTGNDKFWMQLEFGMAKKYVDDLSDNVKRGLRAKIEQGWLPGVAPFGYLNDKADKTIVKDPDRFPILRRMWDLMLTSNYTPRQILDKATNEWGLRTRTFRKVGGGPMAFSAVYKMFTNPFYYGAIQFNGELYEGSHEPLINMREFEKVQELLGLRNRPRPQSKSFPYTGIMKCGECGCAITAENKRNRRYGYEYVYYHCTKRKRQVRCNQKVIEVKQLERQIATFLDSITITEDISDWCISILKELEEETKGKRELTMKSQYQRLKSCTQELQELLNCKIRKLISDEEYTQKRRELQEEKLRIKELINDRDGRFDEVISLGEKAFDFAAEARKKFENGTPEEKRAILRFTGSNLVLKDGKLSIEPQKPLFYIQKVLSLPTAKMYMFEPQKMSYAQARTAPAGSGSRYWLSVVEDVRTFYSYSY